MIETYENEQMNVEAPGNGLASMLPRVIVIVALVGAAVLGWRFFGPQHALAKAGWIDDWDKAVEQSNKSGKPALALFTADWCPPCKTLKSQVLSDPEVQKYLRENYTLVVVDLSDRAGPNNRRAAEFGVRSIPTLIAYNESGQEAGRAPGMPADALLNWLRAVGTGKR